MKRFYALIMFVVCTANAMAQDTVHVGEPWYMFKNIYANWWEVNSSSFAPWSHTLMLYYGDSIDSVTVYGVAVTRQYIPVEEERTDEAVTMTPTVMLFGQESYGNPPTVSFIDSANVLNLVKKCWFKYPLPDEKDTVIVPCYEFYFDNPHGFNLPADSFYVSHYYPQERVMNILNWSQNHPVGNDWSYFYYGDLLGFGNSELWGSDCTNVTTFLPTSPRNIWGGLFPIVNLRCTAPTLRLVGRGGDSVTVGWWQAEGGEAYELSLGTYGGDPDGATPVTATDSVHTFTGLQSDTLYSIWVRKACRYTTAGYDTLVWSDWSRPLVCRSSVGIGEVYDGEGLHVAAQDGCVAVQGLASGERAEVYDMKGCRVATLAADGRTAPLPQGVYLVRTTAGRARKAVLTR